MINSPEICRVSEPHRAFWLCIPFYLEISNEKSGAFKVSNKFSKLETCIVISVGDASNQCDKTSKTYGLRVNSGSQIHASTRPDLALTAAHFLIFKMICEGVWARELSSMFFVSGPFTLSLTLRRSLQIWVTVHVKRSLIVFQNTKSKMHIHTRTAYTMAPMQSFYNNNSQDGHLQRNPTYWILFIAPSNNFK